MPKRSWRGRKTKVEERPIEIVPDARPGAEKRAREHAKKKEEEIVRKRLHAADFSFAKKSYGLEVGSDGVLQKSEKDFRQAHQNLLNQAIRGEEARDTNAREQIEKRHKKLEKQGHRVKPYYDLPDEHGITSTADQYDEVKHKDGPTSIVTADRPLGERRERSRYKRHFEYQASKPPKEGQLVEATHRFAKKSYGFDLDSDGFIKAVINRHGTDQTAP